MGLMQALALTGNGAEGYVQGGYDAAAAQRLKDAAAFEQNQRQRLMQQQAAVDAAGNPVTATPDMATNSDGTTSVPSVPAPSGDNIDAGQPGTAPPIPNPTSSVPGQGGGLNPMQTQTALAAANTPQAQAARQAAALSRTDPVAAAKLTEATTQAQAAQMDFASKQFDNDLNAAASKVTAGNWAPLEQTLSESAASGSHGAKFVPVPGDNTKVEANVVNPDGSLTPTGKIYDNSASGAQEAALFLSKATPISAKVAHTAAVQQAASEAEERTARATYWKGMAEAANKKGDAALDRANGTTVSKMNPDDAAEFGDLKAKSEKMDTALTKARLDAAALGQTFDPKDPTLQPLFVQQAAYEARMQTLLTKYRGSQGAADPLGVRTPAPAPTTTTRPATPAETVAQDMAKNNIQNATSTLRAPDGSVTTRQFGTGATPMQGAAAPPPAGAEIPDPPPQYRQVGIRQVVNPDYAAWRAQYGPAWDAAHADQTSASDAGALAAKRGFNPFMQNAVR